MDRSNPSRRSRARVWSLTVTKKKLLFLNRKSPHGNSAASESLDMTLMAAAFEQTVSVVFLDDGVLQLKTSQDTSLIETKDISATFKSLSLYDVHQIYVDETSLRERGLKADDLLMPVEVVNSQQLSKLFADQDIILSF